MHYKFCPECGRRLVDKMAGDDGFVPYCESCGQYWFDSFPSCVIILVANEYNEIALLRQGYLSDRYASFVAGYMTPGENAESCARREVQEELGLELESLEFGGTHWFPLKGLLMIGFIGRTKKADFRLSVEVDSAAWTPLEEVPEKIFPNGPGNTAWALYEKFKADLGL